MALGRHLHHLLKAASDTSMSLEELVIFAADTPTILRETMKKQRALLMFNVMSSSIREQAESEDGASTRAQYREGSCRFGCSFILWCRGC
jgi:hypothetical protein